MDKTQTVLTAEQKAAFRKLYRYAFCTSIGILLFFLLVVYSPHAEIYSPRSSLFFCLGFGVLVGVATFAAIVMGYCYAKGLIVPLRCTCVVFSSEEHVPPPMDAYEYPRSEWYNDPTNPASPVFQARENAMHKDD